MNNSIKAVVTGDNHLNRYYSKMRPEQLEKRRKKLRDNFAKAVDYALKEDVDLFLHCGDLFDMPNPRNQEVAFAASRLNELERNGTEVFMVVGNHDMSLTSEASGSSPQSVFESFQGPHVFKNTEEIESEVLDFDGQKVKISGLSYNPLNSGGDPLEDRWVEGESDWNILITHYGFEGTLVSGEDEPVISKETAESMDIDLLCTGHVHSSLETETGGTDVLVPGGTERLGFNEEEYSTGFYMVDLGEEISKEYVELDSQPMESLTVDVEKLENPQESLMDKIESVSGENKMLRIELEGSLTREQYRGLDIHDIWEYGRQKNFYFDLKDSISLDIESGLNTDGKRLSQTEELEKAAERFEDEFPDDSEVIEKASRKVRNEYRGD